MAPRRDGVTIEQLGSIGELIAAIATIATLAYLARQIRASTIATQSEARRAVRSDSSQSVRLIVSDPDVTRVLLAGLADYESLERHDAVRFRFLLSEFMSHIEAAFREWQHGTGTEAMLRDAVEKNAPLLASPGGRSWLRENEWLYDAEMVRYTRSVLGDP